MDLVIDRAGEVRCLYGEQIPLASLGALSIRRASHVEPTLGGTWQADLVPVNGPVLGPFVRRSDALEAEADWLWHHCIAPLSPGHTPLRCTLPT